MTQSSKQSTQAPPPSHFMCPLTLEVMENPTLSRYGHSFERSAILKWLQDNECCPMTRNPLKPSLLISNRKLASEILAWRQSNTSGVSAEGGGGGGENPPTKPTARTPEHFYCSFTRDVMVHPVVSKYGDRFERAAIEEWFADGYEFCPVTGKPLSPGGLVTDRTLKEEIAAWRTKNGYAVQNHDDNAASSSSSSSSEADNIVRYGYLDSHFGKRRRNVRCAYAA